MCGDNEVAYQGQEQAFGTPPRVWGQLRLQRPPQRRKRNTPTCVGTTHSGASCIKNAPEHPHVCGDNVRAAGGQFDNYGTPPRVWGQLNPRIQAGFIPRNTPTCVGTTR